MNTKFMNYLEQQYWDNMGANAIQAQEYMLFTLLKPKIRELEGQWHVIYQDGTVVGIGDSIYLAILDFNKKWTDKL